MRLTSVANSSHLCSLDGYPEAPKSNSEITQSRVKCPGREDEADRTLHRTMVGKLIHQWCGIMDDLKFI